MGKKLQSDFLSSFVQTLLEGLTDCQSHSASGSCVVLNSIVRIRGQELKKDVSFTVVKFLKTPTTGPLAFPIFQMRAPSVKTREKAYVTFLLLNWR